jgi:flavin-dependent dehydrogenase
LSKELEKSIHISKIIEGASLDFSTIKIMPTGTSRLDVPYGDYWIAVGDAAFSFDPISSYGITSALGSGFYAGHALASQLLKEEDAMTTYRYVLENTFEVYLNVCFCYFKICLTHETSRTKYRIKEHYIL